VTVPEFRREKAAVGGWPVGTQAGDAWRCRAGAVSERDSEQQLALQGLSGRVSDGGPRPCSPTVPGKLPPLSPLPRGHWGHRDRAGHGQEPHPPALD